MSAWYGGDRFVAVGENESTVGYSDDGISQTTVDTGLSSGIWSSICQNAKKFIAMGQYLKGSQDVFAYSSDSISWSLETMSRSASWLVKCSVWSWQVCCFC